MNAEYLLDAIGLLDDGLIREAEEYSRPGVRWDYRRWAGLAACAALVLALGYGVTHLRMAGQNASNGMSGGATCEPAASDAAGGETLPSGSGGSCVDEGDIPAPALPEPDGPNIAGGSSDNVESREPGTNGGGSVTGDWFPAIRVDGVVYYWDTKEYIHLELEEDDIRYTTSFINSWEPEEDGQANFLPIGLPYVVLDNGTVAVLHNEETNTWKVYDSVPPWEK